MADPALHQDNELEAADVVEEDLDAFTTATPQRRRFAAILWWGARVGLSTMLVTYVIYVSGVMEPYTSFDRLPEVWSLEAPRYAKATGEPTGWGWVSLLDHADILNLVGLAVLASLTAIALATLLPMYLRQRNYLYLTIAGLQILVIVLSAMNVV